MITLQSTKVLQASVLPDIFKSCMMDMDYMVDMCILRRIPASSEVYVCLYTRQDVTHSYYCCFTDAEKLLSMRGKVASID